MSDNNYYKHDKLSEFNNSLKPENYEKNRKDFYMNKQESVEPTFLQDQD